MIVKSYMLSQESASCADCGKCSQLLPGFIEKYQGELVVSKVNYDREHIRAAIDYLIRECPAKAINIRNLTTDIEDFRLPSFNITTPLGICVL